MGPLIPLALLCLLGYALGSIALVTRLCSGVLCFGYLVMLWGSLLWLPGYALGLFALVTRLCSGILCFGYPVMLRGSCFGYPVLLRDPFFKCYTPDMVWIMLSTEVSASNVGKLI